MRLNKAGSVRSGMPVLKSMQLFMRLDCRVCRSLSGQEPISPGPAIHDGCFWRLEHAYPTRLAGWLVIILKRHAEALHELTLEEFQEWSQIQARAVKLLHRETGCRKEYVAFFAEKEGFNHVHIHLIPRPVNLPDDLIGAQIFKLIQVDEAGALARFAVSELSERLRSAYEAGVF